MKRVLAWGMAVLGAVAAARGEEGRGERVARWGEVFGYCQRVAWRYDGEGRAVEVDAVAEAEKRGRCAAVGDGEGIDSDGWAADCASEGDEGRKAAVLAWLAAEREVPGETVLVAGAEAGGVWVLSERGVASRCLKRHDAASGRVEEVAMGGEGRELVGPVFGPDGAGGVRLAGLTWRSAAGVRTEWGEEAMEAASRRVEAAWPGSTGLDWVAHAGEAGAGRWIVRVRSAVRPPVWVEVDVAGEGIRVLGEGPEGVSPTVRRVVRWEASDGTALDGVFTRPAREGRCPLVVFPHGGPGTVSTVDFDERAWALADAGFAVFQPNYRGSAGRGKAFRLAGWGAEGIRRAMRDIREGAAAVMADGALGVAEGKAALLGGSWGGYCVLELLALFPEAYAGGAAFFGVYDLPALVESEAARIGRSGDGGAEKAWALRGLWRQFADPSDGEGMAALAEISPIRQLEGIRGPVWLFHKRGDGTIPFEQSERLFGEMSRRGMAVAFREGAGEHGFGPEEEAGVYAELAAAFRGMGAGSGGGEEEGEGTGLEGGEGRGGEVGVAEGTGGGEPRLGAEKGGGGGRGKVGVELPVGEGGEGGGFADSEGMEGGVEGQGGAGRGLEEEGAGEREVEGHGLGGRRGGGGDAGEGGVVAEGAGGVGEGDGGGGEFGGVESKVGVEAEEEGKGGGRGGVFKGQGEFQGGGGEEGDAVAEAEGEGVEGGGGGGGVEGEEDGGGSAVEDGPGEAPGESVDGKGAGMGGVGEAGASAEGEEEGDAAAEVGRGGKGGPRVAVEPLDGR